MVFSTVMVRASRDYHTDTFIATDALISGTLREDQVKLDGYALPTHVTNLPSHLSNTVRERASAGKAGDVHQSEGGRTEVANDIV